MRLGPKTKIVKKNKNIVLIGFLFVMLSVVFWGCGQDNCPPKPSHVIKINSGQTVYNLNRNFIFHFKPAEKNKTAGLLARDGDLIMVKSNTDKEFFFPYQETDGKSLSFTIEDSFLLRLGNSPVSLRLGNKNSWQWLAKVKDEDLSSLRFIEITYLDNLQPGILEKIAAVNPHVGLAISKKDAAAQVVPLFKPKILFGLKGETVTALQPYLDQLQFLSLEITSYSSLKKLPSLPKLRYLMLTLKVEQPDFIRASMNELQQLERLFLAIENNPPPGCLDDLGKLTRLQELFLWAEELTDQHTAFLSQLSGLRTLSLGTCEKIWNVSFLEKLPQLTWLGFPPNISQADFQTIIDTHHQLEVAELLGCEELIDLSPLANVSHLKAVIIAKTKADITALKKIKYLQFAALPAEEFGTTPSENVKKLQKELPTCIFVEVGACMGSGWILLFFPLLFFLRIFQRAFRRQQSKGYPHNK